MKYLIVDDEPLIRKGMVKLISRVAPEWRVCGEAWNGKEGIELTLEHNPHLILTDIRMPEMDGLQMTEHLIEMAIPTPIVFFTGHDEFQYIQTAIKHNAFDYLLKPIKEEEVERLMNRYYQEFGRRGSISQEDLSLIKQYEFHLRNILETQSVGALEGLLKEWHEKLRPSISLRTFIDLTTRTLQTYLLQHGVISAEFKPVINEQNTMNVLHSLIMFCTTQLEEVMDQPNSLLIQRVLNWVEERIGEHPTLSEAAQLIHLNPTYFSEYFKKHTGEKFLQYVQRLKIQKAKELLADPSLKVYDVAARIGYTDQRHFSKLFQSRVGMTPSEYRNRVLFNESAQP